MAGFPAVLWPCLIGSLSEREVIFHITANPPPDTSKMDKINIHTATKTRAPQSPGHLFDQRLLHKPEQKVHKCFSDVNWQVRTRAPVSGERALEDFLAAAPPSADAALVSGPSGQGPAE